MMRAALRCAWRPLAARSLAAAAAPQTALLGVREDRHSSFSRGAAEGPSALRSALFSKSANGYCEAGLDVLSALGDAGDLDEPTHEEIHKAVRGMLLDGTAPLAIGGDHSVTYPLVRALWAFKMLEEGGLEAEAPEGPMDGIQRDARGLAVAKKEERPLTLLHFDAHWCCPCLCCAPLCLLSADCCTATATCTRASTSGSRRGGASTATPARSRASSRRTSWTRSSAWACGR